MKKNNYLQYVKVPMGEASEIFDDLTNIEKSVIEIIGYSEKIKPTRLQKLSLLVGVVIERDLPKTHSPYFFGAFSDEVDESAEGMREEGILRYEEGSGYFLSRTGYNVFDLIRRSDKETDLRIRGVIGMFSHLPDRQVTALTYALYPEFAGESLIKKKMEKVAKELNLEQLKTELEGM